MHPDNDPQNAVKYGCNILGSYVGSSTYIQSSLVEKLGKLALESEAIKNYPNTQVQHLLLRQCFSQKINHLHSFAFAFGYFFFLKAYSSVAKRKRGRVNVMMISYLTLNVIIFYSLCIPF
jgi:hypothetical protein